MPVKPEDRQETRVLEKETSFATANEVLLAPYALDASRLETVFGQIFAHKVDYADLYFQYTRSESWSLEDASSRAAR
jgi:TldD protein